MTHQTNTHRTWSRRIAGVLAAVLCVATTTAAANDTTPARGTAQSASNTAERTQNSDTSEESTASDEDDSQTIATASKTGLQLGSGGLSADQALAHVDRARARDRDAESDDEERTGEDSARASSTERSHPCEPYPSCARADLGSKDGVDAEPFLEVAEAHNDAIRRCFTDAVDGAPEGRLVLQFEIASDGKARDVSVASTDVELDGFSKCAATKVESWDFPRPSEFGYDSLKVAHPYTFGSE